MPFETPVILDSTGKRIAEALEMLAKDGGSGNLDAIYAAMLDGTNTTRIFKQWWPLSDNGTDNKYERLSRFARMMAAAGADLQYTLRMDDFERDGSVGSPVMTPLDDLADKAAAQLCTDTTTPVDDWADEGFIGGWYVRANALSLADGTMDILQVEGVDPLFDLSGELAPVYTFTNALWKREWVEGNYLYKSWRASQAGGYTPYAGDVDPTNAHRDLTWRPSFPGGYDSKSRLGSGVGQKPYIRKAATTGIADARKVTAYEGLWCDCDAEYVLDMWQLRHFNAENSNILEGCTGYNVQITVSAAESGVKRFLTTAANAANFPVGACVSIGTHPSGSGNDRNTNINYDVVDCAKVLSQENVTVSGTDLVAINLDASSTFDVPATGFVSSMPWHSGITESLPHHKDGAPVSLTNGRYPIRVMGIEMMHGAYDVGLDPLYNVTNYADSAGDYEVFSCKDSTKLAGSITSDYKSTGIKYSKMKSGWNYVKAFVRTKTGVLFPKLVGGSGTTFYKSAFNGSAAAGVRCPWRYAALAGGAAAGLACGSGGSAPSLAHWSGRPRLGGSGKKRGEWPA